jgi:hypothetical protein
MKGTGLCSANERIDFMNPVPGGRTFGSIVEARCASLKPGDIVLIRDLSNIAASAAWSNNQRRGKWQLKLYKLGNGSSGKLLAVNDPAKDDGPAAVPPELKVKLDLPGWYAIWIGVPMMDFRPRLPGIYGGVDVALNEDPAFMLVGPERGTRKGNIMGPLGVEVMCYWKCAKLDGRSLRIRVPYGTYFSMPWGLVRGSVSSLQLVKLSEKQAKAYHEDISDPATKRVIVVNDGFSHYWSAAEPGKGIDARYVMQYRDSDVKMYFFQTPSTGVSSWPSHVTTILGDGVDDDTWKQLRRGDRRAHDYLRWAVDNHQEGYRVLSQLCRRSNPELHASLRMNLFFAGGQFGPSELFINGPFWRQHPELRKPGGVQLDYAQPRVRQFAIDIMMELATNYDVNGISMDFTRWPPVADPARHDANVLTSFIKEVRLALDRVAQEKRRKLTLSAQVVDGYHADMNLVQQKIDLEAWLASRTLDFVCVQAWEHREYLAWARRYHTPYYLIHDQDPFNTPGGWRHDPDWQQADRRDEDPEPGEELEKQPHVNSSLDPTEYDVGFKDRYALGIDGVCLVNGGGNFARRLGHVNEFADRVRTGETWGQKIVSSIEVG